MSVHDHNGQQMDERSVVNEFTEKERKSLNVHDFTRRDFTFPAETPLAVVEEVRTLQREHQQMRRSMVVASKALEGIQEKTFDDLIIDLNQQGFMGRIKSLCRDFGHNLPTVTCLLNDGSLVSYDTTTSNVVDNPDWVAPFTVLKNEKILGSLRNGNYNRQRGRGGRSTPYRYNRNQNSWGGSVNNRYNN